MSTSKLLPGERWAAVRYSGSCLYYVDDGTAAATEEGARRKARAIDAKIPTWAKAHPVLGIVRTHLQVARYADCDALAALAAKVQKAGGL